LRPTVAVIIPTSNSSKTLEACLRSIRAQTYSQIGIVVVDNFSTDNTRRIAEEFGARILDGGNPALARNVGVRDSISDYIFFADSDEILDKNLVNECVRLCEENKSSFVRIPIFFIGGSFIGNSSAFWKNELSVVDREIRGDSASDTVTRFLKRKHVIAAGFFDERLNIGEDVKFKQTLVSIGLIGVRSKSCIYHAEPSRLRDFVRKNIGYAEFMFSDHRPEDESLTKEILRMAIVAFWKSKIAFYRQPLLLVGCSFLLLVKGFLLFVARATTL
jgi:glycosyltransferase involved in cell wall biosynthesis